MKKIVWITFCLLANVAHSAAQEAPKRANEYSFQCGASYWLISKVYAEGKKPDEAARYKSKFDRLSARAAAEFAAINRTNEDAEAYMTQHVQDLVNLADQGKSRELVDFTKRCDELFSD